MEKIQNLVEEMVTLTNTIVEETNANAKGNKAAGRRARKATLTLAKLCKDYRALSMEAEKAE